MRALENRPRGERYGYKMVVVRFNRNGDLMSSKPCRDCAESIKMWGVKKITWSTGSGFETTTPDILLKTAVPSSGNICRWDMKSTWKASLWTLYLKKDALARIKSGRKTREIRTRSPFINRIAAAVRENGSVTIRLSDRVFSIVVRVTGCNYFSGNNASTTIRQLIRKEGISNILDDQSEDKGVVYLKRLLSWNKIQNKGIIAFKIEI